MYDVPTPPPATAPPTDGTNAAGTGAAPAAPVHQPKENRLAVWDLSTKQLEMFVVVFLALETETDTNSWL